MQLDVVAAASSDREWLYALHRAAMRGMVEASYGLWVETDQRARFAANLAGHDVYVARVAAERVGAVYLSESDEAVDLALLEIDPARQRRGLGSLAVRWVVDRAARQEKPVRLQVLHANDGARRLYERLGFRPVDRTATHVVMTSR